MGSAYSRDFMRLRVTSNGCSGHITCYSLIDSHSDIALRCTVQIVAPKQTTALHDISTIILTDIKGCCRSRIIISLTQVQGYITIDHGLNSFNASCLQSTQTATVGIATDGSVEQINSSRTAGRGLVFCPSTSGRIPVAYLRISQSTTTIYIFLHSTASHIDDYRTLYITRLTTTIDSTIDSTAIHIELDILCQT